MWTIDPIDGTKGFLRGEQYAVCIALLVDAQVQLGIIGCPNLPVDPAQPDGERGCLFVAVRGQGCHQVPLHVFSRLLSLVPKLIHRSRSAAPPRPHCTCRPPPPPI